MDDSEIERRAGMKCKKCKRKVSSKAESCPHCEAPLKSDKAQKPKRWHEKTSVTLCIAAGLAVFGLGFIHIITGVVSTYDLPFELPFDIVLKESFGYSETFVDADKIRAIPYTAAKLKYPLGCRALQRTHHMDSGEVFETRMTSRLKENMERWQGQFERTLDKPKQRWQDRLRGRIDTLEMDPEDANAYNNRGIASAIRGQYETAIAEFGRAFRRNPAFAEAYYNRGLVYVAIGQLGRGISDFGKAVEIKPGFTEGYVSRGAIYVTMSQYDQAIADFTKAIETDPTCVEVYFTRSLVCYVKGQYGQAWQDVHKIRGLGLTIPPEFLKNLRLVSTEPPGGRITP